MAPIGQSVIPFRFRDSFFRDPYFSDSWDVMERQRRQFDRDCEEAHQRMFGRPSGSRSILDSSSALAPRDTTSSSLADYFKDTSLNSGTNSSEHDFKTEKDSYKVVLDVQQFKPEELCVKTSDDNNTIIIEGKHEEKKEDSSHSGYIARAFTRKYTLPSDVKLDQLQCNLSSDGVLQVTAPRTVAAITDGKEQMNGYTNASINNTNNGNSSTSFKKDTNERMTVDGRKIESATKDSKYESYGKWKESRGESPVFDNIDNNVASTSKVSSNNVTNGSTTKSIERVHNDHSGFISRMRDMDPFFHALPDFDGRLDSFFKRRFNNSRLLDRDDSIFGIQSDLDNFKVLVDVKQFKPEELSVRSTDNFVIIEGKHEEKEDSHGFISRHFTRKYDLPKGVKADDVQCNMTASGILEIKAPKPKSAESLLPPIGRKVPISSGNNFSNGINGTQTHKVSSSTFERSHVTSPLAADEHTHKISFTTPSQPREQTRREESVESSVSNAGNRRVTIQELSRSSSANSNYNDIHHNHGEHVIPITITEK